MDVRASEGLCVDTAPRGCGRPEERARGGEPARPQDDLSLPNEINEPGGWYAGGWDTH